jgi:hypothetical protein
VRGLVPRTNSVRFKIAVTEEGSAHLEAWGAFQATRMKFAMHVALHREMTVEDLDQRRAQHKALFDSSDPESSVCYAMTGQSDPHVYLHLVRRLPEGLEEEISGSGDIIGSGFIVDPDAM